MKNTKEVTELIKNKKFKTFWHCLDYLLLAGYTPLDAFGLTMKEFGEDKIYSDVAFIKCYNADNTNYTINPMTGLRTNNLPVIIVGIIDESNIHLTGLFDVYRKSISNGTIANSALEIEDTCEKIRVELSAFIIEYLSNVSKKHFGYEAVKLVNNSIYTHAEGNRIPSIDRNVQEQINRLSAVIGQSTFNTPPPVRYDFDDYRFDGNAPIR